MLLVVVVNCVSFFLRTRKDNPWRIIYMESLPMSKHTPPFDLVAIEASRRFYMGPLPPRHRSRGQPSTRPQWLALQLPADVVGGTNQIAKPGGQFVDAAAMVSRDL